MLERLQHRLERIYELEIGLQVDDFLVTDEEFVRHYDETYNLRASPEKLLVHQHDEGADICLYLHQDIVDVLEHDHPMDRLHEGNISQFLIAVEGVSHFLYMAWNGSHDRGISLFELELQAEVDKYISTMILIANQNDFYLPQGVLTRLFLRHSYASDMDYEEEERYRQANYYAYQYCKALQLNCIEENTRSLFNDLRRFYRLTSHHKINYIASAI